MHKRNTSDFVLVHASLFYSTQLFKADVPQLTVLIHCLNYRTIIIKGRVGLILGWNIFFYFIIFYLIEAYEVL